MSYQALYRSWRPQTFSDLVGQPHVKQTLTNAVLSGQVAHAYLFCGPRGTGKTSAAKVLAKAVNCEHRDGADPCNECEACRSINSGSNVDVEEIDAASNRGVDEIRQLRDKVQYAPTSLTRKVYIIDEVHMLTTEAFNALLKTLEEPPRHTLFVLATTEPHKIPGTIVSRCQRFDFRRIAPEVIVERLERICAAQSWQADAEALWKVAQAADGGLRDALGLLEQTAAYGQGRITPEFAAHVVGGVDTESLVGLVLALASRDALTAMDKLLAWYASGKDAARIVQDLLQVMRDLFIVKLSAARAEQTSFAPVRQRLAEAAKELDSEWLLAAVGKLGETYTNLRYVDQPRLALETSILSLTPPVARDAAVAANPAPTVPAAGSAQSMSDSALSARVGSTAAAPATGSAPQVAGGGAPAPAQSVAASSSAPGAVSNHAANTPVRADRVKTRAAADGPRSAQRKLEVLQDLSSRADPHVLQRVQAVWNAVLERVRAQKIQTHAWLCNGQVALCTADEAVLAFSSRIHRDAVMKPADRTLIESALSSETGSNMRILALTREDWEQFTASIATEAATAASEPQPKPTAVDLVDRAIAVFGKEVVEIQDGE
ncbi:DNA polymerase III subunit gamma/tau [Alicyclobacillus sp. ALC3]|uniref:DNA polymerase III subunit gamma/tau n=1 Tax=Alicyclobacillus sp. ALC3 TaxID=2796143 RepID=UPI00237877DF|nr:DNA polymerase III subunit gamma/tau [Alicyclobacillus sp. ALC3]WDL99024.1 DNA polymerase III subunit gamma/tau [Alicyclobacillus sp. ALC3]